MLLWWCGSPSVIQVRNARLELFFVSLIETTKGIVDFPVDDSTMKKLAVTSNGSGPMTTL